MSFHCHFNRNFDQNVEFDFKTSYLRENFYTAKYIFLRLCLDSGIITVAFWEGLYKFSAIFIDGLYFFDAWDLILKLVARAQKWDRTCWKILILVKMAGVKKSKFFYFLFLCLLFQRVSIHKRKSTFDLLKIFFELDLINSVVTVKHNSSKL